jgi:hypothetical protein
MAKPADWAGDILIAHDKSEEEFRITRRPDTNELILRSKGESLSAIQSDLLVLKCLAEAALRPPGLDRFVDGGKLMNYAGLTPHRDEPKNDPYYSAISRLRKALRHREQPIIETNSSRYALTAHVWIDDKQPPDGRAPSQDFVRSYDSGSEEVVGRTVVLGSTIRPEAPSEVGIGPNREADDTPEPIDKALFAVGSPMSQSAQDSYRRNPMQRDRGFAGVGKPSWRGWFGGLVFAIFGAFLVIRWWHDTKDLEGILMFGLGGLAFALNRRRIRVRLAWGFVTFIGAEVGGLIASIVNRLLTGQGSEGMWLVGILLTGIPLCVFSYYTGISRQKCPHCARMIPAEAFVCGFCTRAIQSSSDGTSVPVR